MYCYSINEEDYYGNFKSREDAVAEAVFDDGTHRPGEEFCIWTGKKIPASEFLAKCKYLGAEAIARADEYLSDYMFSDDSVINSTPEQEKSLNDLILNFITENLSFNSYGVDNIEIHEVVMPKEEY
jgi:hypothetical protein